MSITDVKFAKSQNLNHWEISGLKWLTEPDEMLHLLSFIFICIHVSSNFVLVLKTSDPCSPLYFKLESTSHSDQCWQYGESSCCNWISFWVIKLKRFIHFITLQNVFYFHLKLYLSSVTLQAVTHTIQGKNVVLVYSHTSWRWWRLSQRWWSIIERWWWGGETRGAFRAMNSGGWDGVTLLSSGCSVSLVSL